MTSFLLDTNVFLWIATRQFDQIRRQVLTALRQPEATLWLSPLSIVEIEQKKQIRKLAFDDDWDSHLARNDCRWLEFTHRHAIEFGKLPLIHRDPFDRMIVAQAIVEGMTLVTSDGKLAAYPANILKA